MLYEKPFYAIWLVPQLSWYYDCQIISALLGSSNDNVDLKASTK